jgi:hypothetical protein
MLLNDRLAITDVAFALKMRLKDGMPTIQKTI